MRDLDISEHDLSRLAETAAELANRLLVVA